MSYKIFITILSISALVFFLIIKLTRGKVKVFVKKTNYYILGSTLVFALMGLTGWLLREPAAIRPPYLFMILQLAALGLGILHARIFFDVNTWANRYGGKLEVLFHGFLLFSSCVVFFSVFHFFEKAGPDLSANHAANFCLAFTLFPLPLLCVKLWDFWLAIPEREIPKGWTLPIGQPLPSMLPGNSIHLTLLVTESFQSKVVVELKAIAPVERTLGEVFYYLLYRYNTEKKPRNKVEIAEENSRDKVYEWQFFKMVKHWWWMKRHYYKPDIPLNRQGIHSGDSIIVGRMRRWRS
ncbi:MAG: hypothetical protein IPN76_26405 [Saprospiraceae bacterium]|nr:hypothetical protein [Saprospiraceae bacterium]